MFYVHPPHAKRAAIVIITVAVPVVVGRAFPNEAFHLLEGLKDGFQTLLIEHILHHWGEIAVATGAAWHHIASGD